MNFEATCRCMQILKNACASMPPVSNFLHANEENESGRIIYTISILLMFSLIILLLMVRTIKRENNEFEMENLLDAMRFREELDFARRQKRRLLKTKRKVAAWLTKANPDERPNYCFSSPELVVDNTNNGTTYIPQIVVTPNSEEAAALSQLCRRPRTPALPLMFDFGNSGMSTPRSTHSELYLNRNLSNPYFNSAVMTVDEDSPASRRRPNGGGRTMLVKFGSGSQHSSLQTIDYQRSDSDSVNSSLSC